MFEKSIKYINDKNLKNVAFDKYNNNSCFSVRPLGADIVFVSIFAIKYFDDLYKYRESQPNKINSIINIIK